MTGVSGETEVLLGFLDGRRRGVLEIVEGLSEEELWKPVLPSGWSCAAMFQHLTVNERYWLRWAVGGEQIPGTRIVDGSCQVVLETMTDAADDWQVSPQVSARDVVERYREETVRSNDAVLDVPLDGATRQTDPVWAQWFGDEPPTVRWVLLHMIEETAQHAGHLDVVRELLDGHTKGY